MTNELLRLFDGKYHNRRVLITGHTGFKGSWLSLWLLELGANVMGLSLAPDTSPSHFELLRLDGQMESVIGDIRQPEILSACFERHRPEIVFHLAAQSLVRRSYLQPFETFETNVLGTARVLECCRSSPSLRAAVVVTSDKCYRNLECGKPFFENDALGGKDPYSASKAAAEIVVEGYAHSFFGQGRQFLASARAGNVIGGGDWSADRLLPDLMQACFQNAHARIRNPSSVRPWQYVLDPLAGYLRLGQLLLSGGSNFAQPYNFGPQQADAITVRELIERLEEMHGSVPHEISPGTTSMPEAPTLRLDSSKANSDLGWHSTLSVRDSLTATYEWYRAYHQEGKIVSKAQLYDFVQRANKAGASWTA